MSTTSRAENEALAEEYFTRINDRDLDGIDNLCADGFEVEIARKGTEESVIGADGLKAIYEEYFAAFPDIHIEIDTIVAGNEHVAMFTTTTGTHEGEFRGIEPTGNEIEVQNAGLVRVEEGKMVDLRPNPDMLGLFEQLGVQLDL